MKNIFVLIIIQILCVFIVSLLVSKGCSEIKKTGLKTIISEYYEGENNTIYKKGE